MVIVEALACGVPVLTSRLAGAAVTVREGQTGQLLDNPNDVVIDRTVDEMGVLITLTVNPADMGKIIGRMSRDGNKPIGPIQAVAPPSQSYFWRLDIYKAGSE